MAFIGELRRISGGRVLTRREELIPYLRDASYFRGQFPEAAVLPESAAEISKIMKLCNQYRVPVTVRGGGSSLTGSSVPTNGGLVISMARMNRILETKIPDSYTTVEAGVTLDDLNSHLSRFGFLYPPDPASSMAATVGGTIATNAGGLRAVMYGTTKDWVLGLEVVLPTGEVLETGGRMLKRTKGYDLTSLMIGSEGTLAIITKAILKIWPLPETTGRVMAYFKSIRAAGDAISELKSKGVTPYTAEFMDKLSLDSILKTKGLDYPHDAEYLLIVDVASTKESVDRQLKSLGQVLESFDPVKLVITRNPDEMKQIYEARKGLYSASLTLRDKPEDYVIIADIIVPPTSLPETLTEAQRAVEESGLRVSIFGHIGDGNIHANIFVDTRKEEQLMKANDFQMRLGKIAISHGGSVSAEHGIGLEKKQLILEEFKQRESEITVDLMRKIKAVFDPNHILNGGKIFD
jgi:glycolate oxidase